MATGSQYWLICLFILVCLAKPALAFGAGNISSSSTIEGINWRHGDIEDALLGIIMARTMNKKNKAFSKVMVARVYFGNWLRDYSQAVDVGTIKSVSYEAIRLVVAILGFMNFGFGSKEFEVTPERLGCYRPEEHIDNPKGYAAGDDARRYWHGLRGPVDEELELAIDPNSGMLNYIANEHAGIANSASLLRNLLGRCIDLARIHARNGNEDALYESMRLLGTALHCLEDFFAHSNYIELALIEMGERDVFPHVGRDVRVRIHGSRHGSVYPVVTGTFGEVDFLHSVAGEVSDKLKQNEMQELEQYLEDGKNNDTSLLRNLLNMIPSSLFGGENQEQKMNEIQQTSADAQYIQAQPHQEPEEITKWVSDIFRQVVPIIEWHDRIMKIISDALPSIPILPKIIEQLEDQLNAFVMATIAPFVVPVLQQIQNEMQAGSEGIIESSKADQHRVFEDDDASDPTHSMLSKDHFTNLLNEPAGKTAFEMVKWVVPQIMEAIDDESIDIGRTVNRIIYGVLHHPAQRHHGHDGVPEGRELFFRSVESWWNSMPPEQQDEYRQKLSREGVENGENHKEGQWDSGHGHGCLGKLEQHSQHGSGGKKQSWDDKIATAAADAIIDGVTNAFSGMLGSGGRQGNNGGSDGPGGIFGAAASLVGGIIGQDDSGSGRRSPGDRQAYDNSSSYSQPNSWSDSRPSYGDGQEYREHYSPHDQNYGRSSYQDYHRQEPSYDRLSDYQRNGEHSYGRQSYGDSYNSPAGRGESASYYESAESTEHHHHGSSQYGSGTYDSGYGGYRSHDQGGYHGHHTQGYGGQPPYGSDGSYDGYYQRRY
ncbi:heterokaryon incompatibility protein Het-C-domain-containing protein [Stachybotrys elegans]|uniref:Heterokaryon incompatibility protein Het-C-domain-containing protein n=1 Tax=Stachybotrys elegans TaxID=80388 RepID=A0A8K0SLR5_9HYPO|nr:heterokaryon incompatibility protein Het-C-domain-containing protein [Stachybotrys elegans]